MSDTPMNPARSFTLLTCSGVSNTGRLTTQAAMLLVQRNPDLFECHLTAKQATEDRVTELERTDCLVVVEGCGDRCAARRLQSAGIEPGIHLIATDLGIEKKGMAEVEFWEIEELIQGIQREVQKEQARRGTYTPRG